MIGLDAFVGHGGGHGGGHHGGGGAGWRGWGGLGPGTYSYAIYEELPIADPYDRIDEDPEHRRKRLMQMQNAANVRAMLGIDLLSARRGDIVGHRRGPNCPPLTHCTDLIGTFDLGSLTKDMNGIKPVTVSVAAALYRGGANAIEQAKLAASAHSLPGGAARDECFFKLQWHRDAILKQAATPNAIYGAADDLKKWCLQAFIEWNAVEAGVAQLDAAWAAMWGDVKSAIAALPQDVIDKANQGLSTIQWIVGGVAVIVLGAFGITVLRGRR